MKLIAKKPCSFGGKQFFIGNEIPADLVLDPKAQEKMGVLVSVAEQEQTQQEQTQADPVSQVEAMQIVKISVSTDKGPIDLEVSPEGLNEVFAALLGIATTAEEIVSNMTDGDALILLHTTDSRKSIKAAVEARAKALEEEGEQ